MNNQQIKSQQVEIKCPKGRQAVVVCVNDKCDHNAFCCQQANCCQKIIKPNKCKLKKVSDIIKIHKDSCQRIDTIYNSTLMFFQNVNKMIDTQIKNFKEWNEKSFAIRRVFLKNQSQFMTADQFCKILEDLNEYNEQYEEEISAYLKQWDKNLRQQFSEMRIILCQKNRKRTSSADIHIPNKKVNQQINKNISLTTRIVWKENQKQALSEIINYLKNVLSVNLLFHAGSHEFSVNKFHELCDGIPNTLVIIRNDKDKVYGGFSPLPWGKSKFQKFITDNSLKTFVFSLTQKKRFLLKQQEKHYAIEWNSLFGPLFGRCNMIQVWDKADKQSKYWEHIPFSFKAPNGQWTNEMYQQMMGLNKFQEFKLVDWQVFQVVFE